MMIGHVKNEANPGRPGATLKEGPFSARPVPKCFSYHLMSNGAGKDTRLH